MKDYRRETPRFALCGLNCALCPMQLGGYCPGCGGGEGHQPCRFTRCAKERRIEYCCFCEAYPCGEYRGAADWDSFVTHQDMLRDFARAKEIGIPAYLAELDERAGILRWLLEHCNDGRRKNFFCLAVNLLDLPQLHAAVKQLSAANAADTPLPERAAKAVSLLSRAAARQGILLKLRKRPKKTAGRPSEEGD